MTLFRKAAQATACVLVVAAGAVHTADAEDAPKAAVKESPRKAGPIVLDRTLVSIRLNSPVTGNRPGESGKLFAVDHTTDKAWVAQVASGNARSPAAAKGIVVVGSGGGNQIWGYDVESGRRRWVARSDDSGISSIVISGDSAYFTTYSCTLERVLVESGVHKFRKWISSTVECAPEVAGDTAFASYRGGKAHMISAHSIGSGGETWKAEAPGNVVYAPVVSGNTLYVTTMDGRLAAFDAAKGTQSWSRGAGALSAPVVSDYGLLVVTADAAMPASAPASPAPAETSAAPKPAVAGPGAAGKDDRKTESKPTPKAEGPAAAPAAVGEVGVTLATEGSRRLALVSPKAVPAQVDIKLSGPTGYGLDYQGMRPGVDGDLCVIAMGSRVIALDLKTGQVNWEIQVETKHGQFCQPVFGDGMVFLADNHGFVTAVKRDTGKLVWSYRAEGMKFAASPCVEKNRLVLTTEHGEMLCIPTGVKQGKSSQDPAPVFQRAVVEKGGVKPARDVPDPRTPAPLVRGETATPIEPPPVTGPNVDEPPTVTEADPFEGVPKDRRVGPGGVKQTGAGPGGIAPKEDPPSPYPNPFEKK